MEISCKRHCVIYPIAVFRQSVSIFGIVRKISANEGIPHNNIELQN